MSGGVLFHPIWVLILLFVVTYYKDDKSPFLLIFFIIIYSYVRAGGGNHMKIKTTFNFYKRQDIYIDIYNYISIYIYIFICIYISISIIIHIQYIYCRFKRKTEAQVIFLYPFTVCSSCKRKFVVCPFVYEETYRSYLFANGLNGLNGLAQLYAYVYSSLFCSVLFLTWCSALIIKIVKTAMIIILAIVIIARIITTRIVIIVRIVYQGLVKT